MSGEKKQLRQLLVWEFISTYLKKRRTLIAISVSSMTLFFCIQVLTFPRNCSCPIEDITWWVWYDHLDVHSASFFFSEVVECKMGRIVLVLLPILCTSSLLLQIRLYDRWHRHVLVSSIDHDTKYVFCLKQHDAHVICNSLQLIEIFTSCTSATALFSISRRIVS